MNECFYSKCALLISHFIQEHHQKLIYLLISAVQVISTLSLRHQFFLRHICHFCRVPPINWQEKLGRTECGKMFLAWIYELHQVMGTWTLSVRNKIQNKIDLGLHSLILIEELKDQQNITSWVRKQDFWVFRMRSVQISREVFHKKYSVNENGYLKYAFQR